MSQSIIVYRNPAEQMFWEGGYALPLITFLVVFFVCILLAEKAMVPVFRISMFSKHKKLYSNVAILVSFTLACFSGYYFLP